MVELSRKGSRVLRILEWAIDCSFQEQWSYREITPNHSKVDQAAGKLFQGERKGIG
jgi:hypothetical protein